MLDFEEIIIFHERKKLIDLKDFKISVENLSFFQVNIF